MKALRWVAWASWLLLCAAGTYFLARVLGSGVREAVQLATLVIIVWLAIPAARVWTGRSHRRS